MFKRLSLLLTISNGVFTKTRSFNPEHLYTTPHIDYSSFDEVMIVCTDKFISPPYLKFIDLLICELKVPLSISGNINSLDDARFLFDHGADRIIINRSLWKNSNIFKEIANIYGKQSIVASIDFLEKDGKQLSFNWENKKIRDNLMPTFFQDLIPYIGEVLIQDVDQDGRVLGPNLNALKKVCNCLPKNMPIHIGSCGLVDWEQYSELLSLDFIDAVSISNVHHMSKTALSSLREYCIINENNIRG